MTEEKGSTYVYTEYNEGKDELGGKTQVETGASDGQTVEIVYGLESGDEYYYRYADSVSYNAKRG